jgi:predicted transcriptional regulator with HTH domain
VLDRRKVSAMMQIYSVFGFYRDVIAAAGCKEAEIVRDAIAQYLGKTDPSSVKGALADLQDRVVNVERKLASLGRLVG